MTRPVWRPACGGYNDQCQPQIEPEINNRGAVRMVPVMNHNFRKPFPLRVYEWRNWGVPRRRDNDDLWQGVLADNDSEFEASGGFPRVAARVFDEQDEFFHFFEMVMIFYFHNGRIFNKGSNGGWSIHLEKKMILILIIMLTIKVKITKDLRWRGIYWVSMTDYILKIFLIGFILTKTFSTIWIFQKKIK